MLRQTHDLDLVRDLNRQNFLTEPIWIRDIKRCTWWVYWLGDDPVGFCGTRSVKDDPDTWFLARAGVCSRARGRGIQRHMIRTRCRYARAHGAKMAITYTVTNNVPSANNLIRTGFVLYEPAYQYAGSDMLYWWKDL